MLLSVLLKTETDFVFRNTVQAPSIGKFEGISSSMKYNQVFVSGEWFQQFHHFPNFNNQLLSKDFDVSCWNVYQIVLPTKFIYTEPRQKLKFQNWQLRIFQFKQKIVSRTSSGTSFDRKKILSNFHYTLVITFDKIFFSGSTSQQCACVLIGKEA